MSNEEINVFNVLYRVYVIRMLEKNKIVIVEKGEERSFSLRVTGTSSGRTLLPFRMQAKNESIYTKLFLATW
jgi:hypothetical protein